MKRRRERGLERKKREMEKGGKGIREQEGGEV